MLMKKLTKYIRASLIVCFAAGLVFLVLLHTMLRPTAVEARLLMNKYTAMNIRQNSGLHKQALVLIKLATNLLPAIGETTLNRGEKEVGTGSYLAHTELVEASFDHYVSVTTSEGLLEALSDATPGTFITIAPGIYSLAGKSFKASTQGGTYLKPIAVTADRHGDVVLEMMSQEGFLIRSPNWHFENLIFRGAPNKDDWIEHAFHLVGSAENISFYNNSFVNFNAHIKANGLYQGTEREAYPAYIRVVNNNFYNEWKRNTRNPVTPIDVVGGTYWEIRDNFIADFGKNGQGGPGITYGAFLKGGNSFGEMSGNLVACSWRLPHTSPLDVRIGLSLGGGGTGSGSRMSGACESESCDGIISNNRIMNCVNDVGIYLNRAQRAIVSDNDLRGTLGVDVRFRDSNAVLSGNLMGDGRIRERDGGEAFEVE